MNRTLTSSIVLLLSSILMTGCGEALPDGMPRLYPATIIVTQEGIPLAGAMVQLIPEDSANAAWGPGGVTDESGSIVLHTNGKYKGAPLGHYKVTVMKREREPHPQPELREAGPHTPEFARFMDIARSLQTYAYVEAQYTVPTDTPLRMEITPRGRTYEVDAGPPVKIAVSGPRL